MDKDHDLLRKEPKLKEKVKRQLISEVDDTKMIMSDEETTPEEKKHDCNFCGKSFSNGKALGGHRRSHFQAARKQKLLLQNKSSRCVSDDDDENDGEDITTCYICKKNFPTKNALYGHMRSHPDRVSKGVSPPSGNHENNNCSSSNNSNSSMGNGSVVLNGHGDDVSKLPPLPKWQMKGKRGRKCSESYEAARNLVLLTEYECHMSIKVENPKVPSPSKKRKIVGESSSSGKEHVVNKIRLVIGSSSKLGKKSDDSVSDRDTHEKVTSVNTSTKPESSKGFAFDLNEPYVEEED